MSFLTLVLQTSMKELLSPPMVAEVTSDTIESLYVIFLGHKTNQNLLLQ